LSFWRYLVVTKITRNRFDTCSEILGYPNSNSRTFISYLAICIRFWCFLLSIFNFGIFRNFQKCSKYILGNSPDTYIYTRNKRRVQLYSILYFTHKIWIWYSESILFEKRWFSQFGVWTMWVFDGFVGVCSTVSKRFSVNFLVYLTKNT